MKNINPNIAPLYFTGEAVIGDVEACRFRRFRWEIEPENRFSSSRSVRRWVKLLADTGTSPKKIMYDKTRR